MKVSLFQTILEGIVSRSQLYKETKRKADDAVVSIEVMSNVMEEMYVMIEQLSDIVQEHDNVMNDAFGTDGKVLDLKITGGPPDDKTRLN